MNITYRLAARGTIDLHPADGLDGWLDAGFGQYNPVPLGGATARCACARGSTCLSPTSTTRGAAA